MLTLSTAASVPQNCLLFCLTPNIFCLWTVTEAYVEFSPECFIFPPLPLMFTHPQATDEDSPPNNILTYTITSASAFASYFRIIVVEGYAGTLPFST